MKKRYQIEKQRAVQRFRKLAAQDDQPIQLVIPLQEILDLIQRGLMNLAMAAFTKLAECVMGHEVTALVGEKNHANPARAATRWGSEPGYCVVGGQKIPRPRRSHPAPSVGFIAGRNLRTRRRFPPRQRPRAVRFFSPRSARVIDRAARLSRS